MSTTSMTLYDAAIRYAELGYSVFPLGPRTKLPRWGSHGLLDASSDVEQVERWWRDEPTCNIGMRTDGLIVIDPDLIDKESSNPKPNPWLTDDLARELSAAPTQRTWSGGRQYIFRQPDGKKYRNTEGDDFPKAIAPHVDTRGYGGYIVLPPSFVKNGKRTGYYEFTPGCELDIVKDLLPEPPCWLIAELDRIEATRGASNGHGKANGHAAVSEKIIPQGKRDGTLASMAGTMRRRGFEQPEIEAALLAVNTGRCQPPMNEADIKRIAASVARYEPSDPAVEDAGPDIEYQRLTAAELDDARYDLEYLIDDTLTVGQPLIMAGGKKCLKTNILIDAAVSLATGKDFLGSIRVNRCARVSIMSGESGLHTIQETARRICRAKGMELRDVPGLFFSTDLPRIGDLRHHDALERFIVGDEIEVLVIDPAYLCMDLDGREGSLFASGPLLRSLSKLCDDNGVTLCLCHHTKKGIVDPFAPPELEHIAWAGFQEFARQWWLLGRRKAYEPGTGEHELWLSVGGSAGHSALWAADIFEGTRKTDGGRVWNVTLATAANAREEAAGRIEQEKQTERERKHLAKVEAAKGAVADALRGVDGNQDTKRAIRERTGLRGAALDEAMAYLIRVGKLVPCEIERENGHKYEGYRYEFEKGGRK